MKHTIKRGETIIGTITCPSESGAPVFGLEVLAESVVAGGLEDNQFTSYSHAESVLHYVWEDHCKAQGIACEPRVVEVEESDEDRAMRFVSEREAEEAAYYERLEDDMREHMVGMEETPEYGEVDNATPERVDQDASDHDDDLPF